MIKAKEEWISEQCDNIEEDIKEGSKKAFDTLKKLTRKQQHKASVIEDKNDSLIKRPFLHDGLSIDKSSTIKN